MATVLFVNATANELSTNLNNQLQNQVLAAGSLQETALTMPATSLPVAAYPKQGVFGAGKGTTNLLFVFGVGVAPRGYVVSYEEGASLNLFIYILGDLVVGADQTGATNMFRISAFSESLVT